MFAAALIAGLIAAPIATLALLATASRHSHAGGVWHSSRRTAYAIACTAIVVALAVGGLVLLRDPRRDTLVGAGILAAACLIWLPLTRRWRAWALVAWATGVYLFVVFLAYLVWWTFASGLGPVSTAGGVLLWVFEAFAALLATAYLWELCDALGTEDWRRRVTPRTAVPDAAPFVSLHVPAHNEPPEMVIATLEALTRIDYPNFEIVAIDDNSDDEASWRPVQEWCERRGITFAHLDDWPGYKSGALNYALNELTDPRAEVIGIVDSDYQVHPGWLARCAPLFADPRVGFVQAPQDYRDWQQDPYYRRLYFSYHYFFAVTQPSRNERDGAIFAGTMGLIRREALQRLGGWDEWCITEDAELSLRLLRGGWSGLHVDQSYGFGVMPLTFEALKSQRYRWCFGGIQILRMHWRSLVSRTAAGRMSIGQRWSYFTGALQWYGDLLGVVFFVFLLAGAANLASGGGQLYRKLTLFLVAAITVLVGLGLVRAVALMRRGTGARWRDAIGAFFIWQSTSLVVARASVQALFSKRAAFLRTPKTAEQAATWRAFAANWAETLLGVLGLLGIVGALTRVDTVSGPLIAAMLVFPTLGFLSAPANSLAAQRAALPPELRARRRSEWQRQNRAIAGAATAVVGSGAVVAGVVAILALLLAPSPKFAPPNPVKPNDKPAPSAPASPSPSNGPSPGPSGGPSQGPSSGPSTAPAPATSAPQTTPAPNPPASPAPSS